MSQLRFLFFPLGLWFLSGNVNLFSTPDTWKELLWHLLCRHVVLSTVPLTSHQTTGQTCEAGAIVTCFRDWKLRHREGETYNLTPGHLIISMTSCNLFNARASPQVCRRCSDGSGQLSMEGCLAQGQAPYVSFPSFSCFPLDPDFFF